MNDRECINIFRELEHCKQHLKFSQCEYAVGRLLFWEEGCEDLWKKLKNGKKMGKVISYEEFSIDGMLTNIKWRNKKPGEQF